MNNWLSVLKQWQSSSVSVLAGPILILLILVMMVLPLPPFILDLLFTFNISLAVMVLLVAMFTRQPLDFAAFPAVLLFSTLLRLGLNVASTRVVLMRGHEGPDAAGRVIEAFGHFLVGGNFTVGLIVFIILVIINFVVITKGAGRIAEVGARFTLDAMPGKQMAIDADLNAGLIGEDDARQRRQEVAQEAEFYGAMDGASKFVRGDAIAGLLIMIINVVGGLIVGLAQHQLSVGEAAHVYTVLTVGDGLVAQIPALIISTAAGVVVSRVATEQDVGQQLVGQLFNNPRVMYITAGILAAMGLVPNMPHLAFLFLAALLASIGWFLGQQQQKEAAQEQVNEVLEQSEIQQQSTEASWDDVHFTEPLGLEVGYRLIPMVDHHQDGELLNRIRSLRKKFASEVGFLPPVVHIRDNLELKPNGYRILLHGAEIASGEIMVDQWLAIDPGEVLTDITGTPTTDPAFGLPAYWIAEDLREEAQIAGYTVVDASTVLATHINHILHRYSAQLLGRAEVQKLVELAERELPKLVEELIPKEVSLGTLQQVLRGLLAEEVPIRDMRTILEALAQGATQQGPLKQNGQSSPSVNELLSVVRQALGRVILQQWFPGQSEAHVIGLDAQLEQVLTQALNNSGALEPGLAQTLAQDTQQAIAHQEANGQPPVLVVTAALRPALAQFLRAQFHQLVVLAIDEIPEDRMIQVDYVVGQQPEAGQ
ncbi:MAG TPA: flagellar biosynthesis protein FlhA [Paenalcaligenes sp.]|nr:flagellar biosynthesis protein FlhA [Paenalcaligenes sp.]